MVKSSFSLDEKVLYAIASAACGLFVGWWLRGMKSNDAKDEKSENKLTTTNNEEIPKYDSGGEFKLVVVVRQDLKMGKGKIAAQCSHAAVGAYKKLFSKDKKLLQCWEYCGQPKVVVKCQDEEELMALFHHAKAIGVTATLIHDAGRTQISAGSKTVLGVGPAPEDKVNMITGHLRWFGICVNLIKQVQQSFSSTFLPSYKLMLVVRQDLGMSKGKIAAQCAHAAVGAYKQAVGSNAVRLWELSGQQKVAVKCKDVSELLDLCEKAKAVDLPVTLVQDAGRTQVKRGEHTVLAVGPGPSDKIDMITGRLKLM